MKFKMLVVLYFYCCNAFPQQTDAGLNPKISYKKAIVFGGNYTFISGADDINNSGNDFKYKEHTLAVNLAFDFSKHLRVGVDYKKIYVNSEWTGKTDYYLLGAFAQYKFGFIKQKNFFFGEVGYYKGNYCVCTYGPSYKKEGLDYLSFGGGYNLKLYNNFRLDLAFTNAQIISKKIDLPFAFTQYIVGIDYMLPFTAGKK